MRHRIGTIRWVAALVLVMAACDGSPTEPEDVTFAASLGIDLARMTKLPSGVYIQTVTPGPGPAVVTATNNWAINYKFWLPDGTLVDQGVVTRFGGTYIEGFEIGILGAKLGEVRKIVIPSRLGYGKDDYGEIPGNSVLVYEITAASIIE
jgi:FKBP-type peptidyl-prolyl cis-trans isomerase